MQDRRTIKTKRAIREAFLSLLKKKSLNKITVAEVSQKADLGRGTFYLHYKDIYDLYNQIENDLYIELEQLFDNAYPSTDPTNLFGLIDTITKYLEENRKVFLLLIRPEDNGKTLHKLKTIFSKKVLWETSDLYTCEYDIVESMFIVTGVIGVVEEWLANRIELTQKQLADMIYKVILKIDSNNENMKAT